MDEREKDPPILVFDFSRSDSFVPWDTIESLLNGEVSSTKYNGRALSIDRPHVVCFANRPPPDVGAKVSADRVIDISLRHFAEGLEDILLHEIPDTLDDLRRRTQDGGFPGVTLYDDYYPEVPSAHGPDSTPPDSGLF